MHTCPECGYKMGDGGKMDKMMSQSDDREIAEKDAVLGELEDMLDGALGGKLEGLKPRGGMKVEVVKIKPKVEEEDDEYV